VVRALDYAVTYLVSIVIILVLTGNVTGILHRLGVPGRTSPVGCWFDPYNGQQCQPTCEDLREAGVYPADTRARIDCLA